MQPEYLSYVEQDATLFEAVAPVLPALRSLSAE